MNKIQTIIVSILLILAAVVIHILIDDSVKLNEGLIRFFSGFCFAGGIALFLTTLFKKKN